MSSYVTPKSAVSKKRTSSTLAKSGARRKLSYGPSEKKLQVYRPMRSFNQVGFPKTLKFIHKYCDNVSVSGSAGIPFKYQFSCNGLYDPNITGTGHQPMYFDQVTPIYNQYRVIGAKARALSQRVLGLRFLISLVVISMMILLLSWFKLKF